jgi:outer membrane protein OmpA-like peptidoglycan-associated protein
MKSLRLLTVALFVIPTFSNAQVGSKLLQKANVQFESMAYAQAIELYETAFKKEKNFDTDQYNTSQLNLATSYFLVKDFEKAEANFRDVLSRDIQLKGEILKAYLRYAQTLSINGKHQEASKIYGKYTSLQEQDKRGIEFIKLYNNIEALSRNASSYRIEYLGLNTGSADFSPTFYKDGLVFVSGRGNTSAVKRMFSWDNSPFLSLFFVENKSVLQGQSSTSALGSSASSGGLKPNPSVRKVGDDYYTPATANDADIITSQGSDYITGSTDYVEYASIPSKGFSRALNSKYHEGPCTFYHTEDRVIFTRNNKTDGGLLNSKSKDVSRLKLYSAVKKSGDWQQIKELPFNSDEYSCGHPTLTVDDQILYFVSDMPGGYGGTDIYLTRFTGGEWSKPVNLGGSVNSQGSEMFPYVDDRGNLYFSTDGHPGLGGLDMFFVSMNTATGLPAGKARNLGAPLNSNKDDFGILTDSERKEGYFSSNRKRGNADDDIYGFERLGALYGCRELIVNVFDNNTKKALPNVRFKYVNKKDTLFTENVTTNVQGNVRLCLEADNEFIFDYLEKSYEPLTEKFDNYAASDYEPSVLNVYLKPEVVKEKKQVEKEPQRMIMQRQEQPLPKVFAGVITSAGDAIPVAGVRLKFTNLCSGLSQEYITRKDGSYEFERDIGCDYELVAMKGDFALSKEIIPKIEKKFSIIESIFKPKVRERNTPNYSGSSLFDTKLYRVGDVVKLNSIYYESNTWKLNNLSERELDRLVATMNRYPNMIVEIRSHTDSRGNAGVNLALSKQRVGEVAKYLEKKKIDSRRIKGIGMGETQPVNKCGDGMQCTEAEYQQNRRTEFKVLQIEKIF